MDEGLILDEPGLDPGAAPTQIRDLLHGKDHERRGEGLRERRGRPRTSLFPAADRHPRGPAPQGERGGLEFGRRAGRFDKPSR